MIKDQRGQSLVEFALVIPVFLLLVLFIVDLGRVAYTYTNLHFTVQETVRQGSFGHSDIDMISYAKAHFTAGNPNELSVSISPSESVRRPGDQLTVKFSYPLEPVMPLAELAVSGPIDLKVDSTIRIE
ncbi:TadE/TadG family type IV pilus assembly protein [Chungangia koreensis]|uniref:TadE/TadG family type IV pilus assembly protein n=1 Tax=Chungangia koreensis TaxID=752657 RepID=A0ABV8X6M1_9LACT